MRNAASARARVSASRASRYHPWTRLRTSTSRGDDDEGAVSVPFDASDRFDDDEGAVSVPFDASHRFDDDEGAVSVPFDASHRFDDDEGAVCSIRRVPSLR